MTQPQVEHLTIQTDRPAEAVATGLWPPLPVGLWLPPAAGVLSALALVTALCLTGAQGAPEAPAGWLEPHNAPVLIAWVAVLAAVFLGPQLCAPGADNFPAAGSALAAGAKRAVQAAAVALPIAAIAWAFHSIGLLLGSQVTPTAQAIEHGTSLAAVEAALPPGLLFAAVVGLVAGASWVWIRRQAVVGTLLLAGWSALPPLAWFLSVDILGRDPAPFPDWLTVNPVYLPVLLARQPQLPPSWAVPALAALLIAPPLLAAGYLRRGRRSRRSTPVTSN